MAQLDWKDVLNIGLPRIDEQHKELIALSNGLLQAMVNGMGADVLEDVFNELRDYTCTHFADEERYMEELGYPQLVEHQAAHRQLTRDVDQFRIRLLSGKDLSPTEALDFLNNWIIKHIMEMDSQIGIYAKSL